MKAGAGVWAGALKLEIDVFSAPKAGGPPTPGEPKVGVAVGAPNAGGGADGAPNDGVPEPNGGAGLVAGEPNRLADGLVVVGPPKSEDGVGLENNDD